MKIGDLVKRREFTKTCQLGIVIEAIHFTFDGVTEPRYKVHWVDIQKVSTIWYSADEMEKLC